MPAAAPVVAGALFSSISITSVAGAISIGFSMQAFVGSLILGGLSYALTPKPKSPSFEAGNFSSAGLAAQTVSVRQPDLTRQIVYGHTRITRGYAQIESTGENGTLHVILILCQGPLRSINEIWVNDYCIPPDWIDGSGNITQGRYQNVMTIKKHLGTPDQAADMSAVSAMSQWDNTCKLSGIAYLYVTMKKDRDAYPNGVPNLSAIVEGPEIYDPRVSELSWSTNIALYQRDFILNNVYGFGASLEQIDDDNISVQANICDEIVTVAAKDFTVSSVNVSSNIFTLEGDLLQLQYGDRITLVATGIPPGGLVNNEYYYVIPYQILTQPRVMLASSLQNAMAKIPIDITDAGSGSFTLRLSGEPRYHGSGVHDTENTLSKTLNDMASSMAGRAVCVAGNWTLLAGVWRTPDINLGLSDIRAGGIGFKSSLSMSESYNVVQGLYISQSNLYQDSNYPPARYQSFIDDDNGLESPKEINLPYTTRYTTAQRIAKIELFKGRQDIVVTSKFSMKALEVQPGDNVTLTIDHLGWDEKPFEITEFSVDINNGAPVVGMSLRETAQAIFDWTSGEAIDFDPAPNTNLPNAFLVDVVGGFSLDSILISTQSVDKVFSVEASWETPENGFVNNGGKFEIEYKESNLTVYKSAGIVDGSVTKMILSALKPDILYDIRIFAYNILGVRSQPSTILNFLVGTTVTTDTEDWENETLTRDGDDWENDTLPSEDWES